MKHFEFEMSLYIDGELPEENEKELFIHLSNCSQCREQFLKFHKIRENVKNFFVKRLEPESAANVAVLQNERENSSGMNISNEPSVKKNIRPDQISNDIKVRNKFYKYAFYISSSAALLLLFLSFISKPKIQYLTKNEVRVDTVFVQKEKPALKFVKQEKTTKGINPGENNSTYLKYLATLPSKQIVLNNIPVNKEKL